MSIRDKDFKAVSVIEKKHKLHWHNIVLAACLLSTLPAALLMSQNSRAIPAQVSEQHSMSLPLPALASDAEISRNNQENQPVWYETTVKDGDTLAMVFDRAKVSAQSLHNLLESQPRKTRRKLTHLIPGQFVALKSDAQGSLSELVYKQDILTTVRFEKQSNGDFTHQVSKRDYERRTTHARTSIRSSLFEAAQSAGLSQSLTMDMAHIFGWDIDFALDIREGDEFTVLYEELFLDGKKVRDGNILAAEFINQNREVKALRYTNHKGHSDYYSPDGHSMRKAFLRTPVDFTRISSRYGKRRHPTLNKIRKHKGVDYAASRGTPIKASGDGKVIWKGQKGGYGRTVIIKHGSRYSTLYAHMNSYNRSIRPGRKVRQGQIIGYVGSSGRATGPHLHYEFRVNGVHRNPLTVRLPQAAPIPKKYREDFTLQTRAFLAQLEQLTAPLVASAQ